eukprot:scpid91923/ scgid15789/ 
MLLLDTVHKQIAYLVKEVLPLVHIGISTEQAARWPTSERVLWRDKRGKAIVTDLTASNAFLPTEHDRSNQVDTAWNLCSPSFVSRIGLGHDHKSISTATAFHIIQRRRAWRDSLFAQTRTCTRVTCLVRQ